MRITVIGTGYVGLVAGACFADTGNTVTCVDRDAAKIAMLQEGKIPIYEPGLEEIVRRAQSQERLFFTTDTAKGVAESQIVFMAVGTPSREDGSVDLSFLEAAVREVARSMKGFKYIVNKSTVPVGAHQRVAAWIRSETNQPFEVISNPEFLKEGTAVDDFLRPDRVVIGTFSDEAFHMMEDLYQPFVRQGNAIVRMEPVSAEITKYACNAFLATRISFMNELSLLCEAVSADIEDIRRGMVTDARIGRHFLYAGAGYGGSCFPKDVKALLSTARSLDVPLGIVEATEIANQRQKKHLLKHVAAHFGKDLSGKTMAIWGLAFKPNTDDIREAPSVVLIDEFLRHGAQVKVFDPVAMKNVEKIFGSRIKYCNSIYQASENADAAVLVTEWNEFRKPDFSKLSQKLRRKVIFDGRNIYNPHELKRMGFSYYGIGRKPS